MDFVESNLKEKKGPTLPEEGHVHVCACQAQANASHWAHLLYTQTQANEYTWVVATDIWETPLRGRALASAWLSLPGSWKVGITALNSREETETWTQSIFLPSFLTRREPPEFLIHSTSRAGQVTWFAVILPISLSVKQEQLNLSLQWSCILYHLHSLALEMMLRTDGGEGGVEDVRVFCRHKTTSVEQST